MSAKHPYEQVHSKRTQLRESQDKHVEAGWCVFFSFSLLNAYLRVGVCRWDCKCKSFSIGLNGIAIKAWKKWINERDKLKSIESSDYYWKTLANYCLIELSHLWVPLACGRGMDFFSFNLISKLHIAGATICLCIYLWLLHFGTW